MRIGTTVLATIVGLSSSIGFANADHRNLQGSNNWRSLNPVIEFSDLVIRWVRESERGPTISGHFMVHVNAALFNAWAAFEDGTTGVRVDLDRNPNPIRVPSGTLNAKNTRAAQLYAMYDAAFIVIVAMGETLLNQKYLEIENDEDAALRKEALLLEAGRIRNTALEQIKISSDGQEFAGRVSESVFAEILTFITMDGSNYQEDYKDTTGYKIRSWCLPVPVINETRISYNFVDGSWVEEFVTYNATTAFNTPNPGDMQVNPAVLSGEVRLTETWQSLSQYGVFPPDKDGGAQIPLSPHWGKVTPVSLTNSSELRSPSVIGPYLEDNITLNTDFMAEVRQVVELAKQQQDGVCPECRASSEYWELGDEFPYPSGWWVGQATQIAKEKNLDLKESLQLIFGLAITVFDAGIAAWEMKYFYDTVRPFTVINEMFSGSNVPDWTGTGNNKIAAIDDKDHWRPYQLRRNTMPPFPDVPSGHSTYSTSSSVVLRNLLGTNQFGFTSESFTSRFDLTDGFNGDPADSNEETTLSYDTFSQAADAAGFSRLLGGIHFMQGNILGLEIGAQTGHKTVAFLREAFGEPDLGADPVADVFNDIIFGTGKEDTLTANCVQGSPVEVYGFYGDDVLIVNDEDNCGPVNLFGGDGADTFKIGRRVTIQDYEENKDTIELLQASGTLSRFVANDVTTIFVDNTAVVDLDGRWRLGQLNIQFQSLF